MKRNDRVMLGDLKEGDRFCYPGKLEAWEVVKQEPPAGYHGHSYTYINRFDPQGRKLDVFDTKKNKTTEIVYLRSTK